MLTNIWSDLIYGGISTTGKYLKVVENLKINILKVKIFFKIYLLHLPIELGNTTTMKQRISITARIFVKYRKNYTQKNFHKSETSEYSAKFVGIYITVVISLIAVLNNLYSITYKNTLK